MDGVAVKLARSLTAFGLLANRMLPESHQSAEVEVAFTESVANQALIAIMVVGAIFAVANTMYAAVDGRKREIAMLRTIGFSKASILTAFIVESVLICTCACVAGLAACTLVHGSRRDFLSDTTWTVMAYELRITPAILAVAMGTAILVGAGGALMPALKASRTHVIEALRKA
ncbi:MAG: FtsX-like permease family protein [Planctomycetes bacterium]|nr:FtsX-like permease family protein [Planctomycetota bacterium]